MEQSPLVYAILLNWNGWRDTLTCLASCRTLTYPNLRILVVDNASTDDSTEQIRAAAPDIVLLQSGENIGFGRGNNVGIRYAMAQRADYIWFLNTDTTVEPETLSALVERAQCSPRIGFVGSKIYDALNPRRVWYAGGNIHMANGAAGHFEVHGNEPEPPPGETAFASGCSMLVRRAVVEDIGAFDDLYFLYYEDVDWQVVAHRRGWISYYEPRSLVYHNVSSSIGPGTRFQTYHYTRSRIIFILLNQPSAVVRSMAYTLSTGLRDKAIQNKWQHARTQLTGMFDGVQSVLAASVRSFGKRRRSALLTLPHGA